MREVAGRVRREERKGTPKKDEEVTKREGGIAKTWKSGGRKEESNISYCFRLDSKIEGNIRDSSGINVLLR